MLLPEYVTAKEVARVCAEIGIDDWSKRKEAVVSQQEASKILKIVNVEKMKIPPEDFRMGLEVELEPLQTPKGTAV